MPKSVPLRLMAVTTEEAVDAARRVGDGLAHCHCHVEKELVVPADEIEAAGQRFGVLGRARQRRRQQAQQQARAGDVPLVHLIAHGEPAGDDGLERDAARFPDRATQRRAQHLAQPREAGQHLGVVAAEAHDLAEALVDRAVGAVAECAVLHDQHGLAQRGHAGHRPDRVVVVVGLEPECAGLGLGSRRLSDRSPSPRTRRCP